MVVVLARLEDRAGVRRTAVGGNTLVDPDEFEAEFGVGERIEHRADLVLLAGVLDVVGGLAAVVMDREVVEAVRMHFSEFVDPFHRRPLATQLADGGVGEEDRRRLVRQLAPMLEVGLFGGGNLVAAGRGCGAYASHFHRVFLSKSRDPASG
ncbi:hypothetical protein AJ87_26935 [Rhizobium yanglingense]|nr:hypothetical protein AJ87_26935 [Rhizobium yanglingense]